MICSFEPSKALAGGMNGEMTMRDLARVVRRAPTHLPKPGSPASDQTNRLGSAVCRAEEES